jgi:molybdenum cofactor biosynthesis enzyme MoaA
MSLIKFCNKKEVQMSLIKFCNKKEVQMSLIKFCNKNKCTCWFDDWFGISWKECCEEHDKDIVHARTNNVHEADNKLFKCVWAKSKIMAVVMYIGVKPMSWMAWKFFYGHK